MKTKAEKILVIGSCGSGIESRLLNHNPEHRRNEKSRG